MCAKKLYFTGPGRTARPSAELAQWANPEWRIPAERPRLAAPDERPMSNNPMTTALRRMGHTREEVTCPRRDRLASLEDLPFDEGHAFKAPSRGVQPVSVRSGSYHNA